MFVGQAGSLLPAILAIVLALITKQVYLSLFIGVAAGALLITEFHFWAAFETLFNLMTENVDFKIIIFLIILSICIVIMQKSGAAKAYGDWMLARLKSKNAAMVATALLGVLIFVDDGFNCMTVGTVMHPVTDKFKVSRAKLAYIIDATAAPVCIIAPISSWAAAINSYVAEGSSFTGYKLFVAAIPFNLYALLTLFTVFFICAIGKDYGTMKKFELAAAIEDKTATAAGRQQEMSDTGAGFSSAGRGNAAKASIFDLILPIVILIFTTLGAMIWTGHLNGGIGIRDCFANCSSVDSLIFASLVTLIVLGIMYLPRKIMTVKEFFGAIPDGSQLMAPFIVILVLAWTLKGISSVLEVGTFISGIVNMNSTAIIFLPVTLFLVSVFVSFSSGTSWGTFAIMVPIVLGMFPDYSTQMVISLSAVLAGSVCGDHISPISDTTIMSSSGAQADHICHTASQIQYAVPVIISCCVGYLIAAVTKNWVITLAASIALQTVILLFILRRSDSQT